MSQDNVIAFFDSLQNNTELQQQFQNEFCNQGQVSMENILDSARVVGLDFSIDDLHAAVKKPDFVKRGK